GEEFEDLVHRCASGAGARHFRLPTSFLHVGAVHSVAYIGSGRPPPRDSRMTEALRQPATSTSPLLARSPLALSVWAVVAAFGAYFWTYAFRKPWPAATFADATVWGVAEKSVLVVAQVLGYMLAKFLGIRVIAEMPPQRRASGILALIAGAEVSLVLFGAAP